ncbi:hypothetical protein PUMCH_004306 [Australozyma saopauloensis]|uniref:SIS domain-containing protein n=1 Tax=Australozyma saopauloensis TaxID=291208 RepID=A0AAX4HGC7_9ASCO|nr:hypothetical protein PUMCH_004306 [[Candida] saopauloensis]
MQRGLDFEKLAELALGSIQNTLDNESWAVSGLARQYKADVDSKVELASSINLLYHTILKRGKIVCCGVGKSYKIATKTVATLKSLTINADQLHPTEALHGDLGLLGNNDCLIFFTASGNTPELIQLLPHISPSIPIVLLTCSKKSKLSQSHQVKSLLYAELPEHLKESKIHGIPAPTVSATLSLILADAVVLALAEMIEQDLAKRKKQFSMKHPGGSIGSDLSHLNDNFIRSMLIEKADRESFQSASLEKADRESYSSMLSLNQVKKHYEGGASTNSLESSPVISDSEEIEVTSNKKLSIAISHASSTQCCKTNYGTIKNWSELDFLKNVALFSFVLYEKEGATFAATASDLRDAYKANTSKDPQWTDMAQLLKEFERVESNANTFII